MSVHDTDITAVRRPGPGDGPRMACGLGLMD